MPYIKKNVVVEHRNKSKAGFITVSGYGITNEEIKAVKKLLRKIQKRRKDDGSSMLYAIFINGSRTVSKKLNKTIKQLSMDGSC